MHDDFTVGVGLEDGILVLETFSESDVVVDFTVNSENEALVFVGKGLSTGVCRSILSAPIRQHSSHNSATSLTPLNITRKTLSHARQRGSLD